MDVGYIYEIFEKLLQIIGLSYWVIGFFATYAWACKELDQQSQDADINMFWNPISSVIGSINIAVVIVITFTILKGKRLLTISLNGENKILFFVLCLPLFLVTIIYAIMEMIVYCKRVKYSDVSFMTSLGEILLFCGTTVLIINSNFKIWSFINRFEKLLIKFCTFMSFIGMMNYFMFHMTNQQIKNFMQISSNYSMYKKFFNRTSRYEDNPFDFQNIKTYMQPLAILYSCTCMVYLVKSNSYDQDVTKSYDMQPLVQEPRNKENSESEVLTDNRGRNRKYNKKKFLSFRIPPLSLILGILLITISLLIITILDSILLSNTLYVQGQYLLTIFPLPVHAVSIGLLIMQIKEMSRWPKLKKNKNIVDRTLIWIGTMGQLTISISQIEFFYSINERILSPLKIFSCISWILQTIIQTLTLSLALERKWLTPERKSWQEFICPAVGMLSVNISFLLLDSFILKDGILERQFTQTNENRFFLRMFSTGFHSLGETLGVLQRLHSSLIFIKMIVLINN